MPPKDPRLSALTGPALALALAVDFDAAVRLMVAFGGQRLYVPRQMRAASPFWPPLGEEAAKALSLLYGGEHIEIPLGVNLKVHQRRMQIAAYQGSNNKAAELFRLHRRTIQRIRNDAADGRQADLFVSRDKPTDTTPD